MFRTRFLAALLAAALLAAPVLARAEEPAPSAPPDDQAVIEPAALPEESALPEALPDAPAEEAAPAEAASVPVAFNYDEPALFRQMVRLVRPWQGVSGWKFGGYQWPRDPARQRWRLIGPVPWELLHAARWLAPPLQIDARSCIDTACVEQALAEAVADGVSDVVVLGWPQGEMPASTQEALRAARAAGLHLWADVWDLVNPFLPRDKVWTYVPERAWGFGQDDGIWERISTWFHAWAPLPEREGEPVPSMYDFLNLPGPWEGLVLRGMALSFVQTAFAELERAPMGDGEPRGQIGPTDIDVSKLPCPPQDHACIRDQLGYR